MERVARWFAGSHAARLREGIPYSVARALALVLASFLALAGGARAQGVAVGARLSDGVVKLGGLTKLVVQVDNATNATLGTLPQVKGLEFGDVGQPAVQEFYSIQNGRQSRSRSLTWVVAVRPTQKGDYTIPPVSVQADGRTLQTRELALKVVEDIQGSEFGYFEVDGPTDLVEGQPFVLELRFGWDVSLTRSVTYGKLSVPWLGGFPGLLELDPPAGASGLPTSQVLLNERVRLTAEQVGQQKVGDRDVFVLRVRKRFVATRSGTFELPVSHFEFGRAGREDIFTGRSDPGIAYYKASNPLTIEVGRLPDAGQPLDFSGAVGTLQANATVDRRDVDVGDSIKLTVDWTGTGNLEFFVPPDLARVDAFRQFRVYGSNDRKTLERRSVTYDLAPLSEDVKEIPSVSLSTYDPSTKAYVTVKTNSIPVRVRPLRNTSTLSAEDGAGNFVVDIRDVQRRTGGTPDARGTGRGPRSYVIAGVAGLVVISWWSLRNAVRRSGDPAAPRARARRRARAVLVRALAGARSASDEARALRVFLAARAGDAPEAWVGRDLDAWARERADDGAAVPGPEDRLALRTLFERLDASTWNGRDERVGAADVLAVADRLVRGGL